MYEEGVLNVSNERTDETPQKDLKDMEISSLFDDEFKMMVTVLLTDLGRRIDGCSENINEERKYKY